ncbi:MAG: alpha/beta hydrolase [Microlunatus sp.]
MVALSMLAGLIVAAALVVLPILPLRESILTGVVLLGLASGWALLALLSVRLTDYPQRWAAMPAAFLAVAGGLSAIGSATVHAVLGWVSPPAFLALAIWMMRWIRRQLPSRAARWILYPIVAVLAVASIGGGYETVREALDTRAYPPPGQLVDIGGHRLHLQCTGAGSPTVVLEPGLSATSSDMSWIAPVVAQQTRVCVYDRAGRGWSDPVDVTQDADRVAADLHTLLTAAQVEGPYVLAGHSFGGLYVQDFAARFPDQVAGLVLLDSASLRNQSDQPATLQPPTTTDRILTVVPAAAHLGVGRILAASDYDTLPPDIQAAARANASTSAYLASSLREYRAGPTSRRQATALTDLGAKPLIVLSAGTGHNATWQAAQERLVNLSTNARQRTAPDTTHSSMLADEADSAAASQAILDVVASVRTGKQLADR